MATKPQTQIAQDISAAQQQISIGGIYAHYKNPNQHYKVLSLATLTENNDELGVVYQALYGEQLIFVRTLSVWLSPGSLNGQAVPRFQKV